MDLIKNLAVLNERLGNLITKFEAYAIESASKFATYDKRITTVESFQLKVIGGLAVLSIIIQIGFNIINVTTRSAQFTQFAQQQQPQALLITK